MLRIKWPEIWRNEKAQWESMNTVQKYQFFLALQAGSPYGWGEENPEASDCSGGVCLALAAATGRLIRTTADELYKKFFTIGSPGAKTIQAVFWITQIARNHGGTPVQPGTAVHVAGAVGPDAVLSAEEPVAVIRSAGSLRLANCRSETRGLDMGAFEKYADKITYGIDKIFWKYFEN
jgi:murein DD-endopeptidase